MIGNRRQLLLGVASTLVGLVIAFVDSRPTWDDAGITGVAIAGFAAAIAFAGRRRPWLWALLIGGWVPVFEIGGQSGAYSLLALVFAGGGAACGWLIARQTPARGPAAGRR